MGSASTIACAFPIHITHRQFHSGAKYNLAIIFILRCWYRCRCCYCPLAFHIANPRTSCKLYDKYESESLIASYSLLHETCQDIVHCTTAWLPFQDVLLLVWHVHKIMLVSAFMYICQGEEKEMKWNAKEMNIMMETRLPFFLIVAVCWERKKYGGAFK